MSIRSLVKQILTEKENKKYNRLLQARRMTYRQWYTKWCAEQDFPTAQNLPPKEKAFVLYIVGQGYLAEDAEAILEDYFASNPQVQIVYGDEDIWEQGESYGKEPWFKPDWSPDLLDSFFYFGSVVAVRKSFLKNLSEKKEVDDPEFYAWVHRLAELAGGYSKNSAGMGHVNRILFHCAAPEVIEQYFLRDIRKEIVAEIPLLSIIIPSKDHPELLSDCITAIRKAVRTLSYEVIVVDNGSSEENKAEIEQLPIKYIYHPMEFHFSKMCNMGAQEAKGRLLLFLNDDVELIRQGCLEQMAELAKRPYTGAVGLKLYYPASVKIQHVGITNLPMGPVHKLQFLEDDKSYYYHTNRGLRNVLAVTGACLMVEAVKFTEAGGFSEELRVAFNDVALCFALYRLGYHNVCVNDTFAYHHESLSRGEDESEEKLNRLLTERDKLYECYPELAGRDPYYSLCLSRQGLDTRIRPAFETAGNAIQSAGEFQKFKKLEQYRRDNCVLLRIESGENGILQGYSVILGGNNACYEKTLLLIPIDSEDNQQEILSVPLMGQYRPDLEENMPDQVNVGLSGFWVELPSLKQLSFGNYYIGVAVQNRVTGLKLYNISNRKLFNTEE